VLGATAYLWQKPKLRRKLQKAGVSTKAARILGDEVKSDVIKLGEAIRDETETHVVDPVERAATSVFHKFRRGVLGAGKEVEKAADRLQESAEKEEEKVPS